MTVRARDAEEHIGRVYRERKDRYAHRLHQAQRVRNVLTNQFDTVFRDVVKPGEEPVVGNLIWAAARTISQRVGRMPRIDVQPEDDTDDAQRQEAEDHELQLSRWGIRMNLAATRLQAAYWLVTHDLAPLVVRPSAEYGHPVIEVRDPMSALPGTVWPHKPDVVDVLFANRMTPWAAGALYPKVNGVVEGRDEQVETVVVGEYFDGTGITICLLEPSVVFLDHIDSPIPGVPMCVLTRGFSPDLDFHGQFDHSIGPLVAQAKLFAAVMAYAEQQVAAETVVVGEINSNQGRWATGPGAVNQLTAMPGASATKLINQMSPQVFNELDRLERAIRLGGQFPAQLSGEPVATIATGKGMEELTLSVDDNVAYWQSVLDDAFMRALSLVPRMSKAMGAKGSDKFSDRCTVYVRSLSGADPAETVRLLQWNGANILGRQTIMERLPEVDSPKKEMERLDIDALRETLLKGVEAAVVNGQMDPIAVAKVIKERRAGKELDEIMVERERIEQEAARAAQSQAAQAGSQPQQPPSIDQLLNPALMAEQSRRQALAAARTGPESRVAATDQAAAMAPAAGAGVPGGTGVPAKMSDTPNTQPVPMPGQLATRTDRAPGQPIRVPTGVPYGKAKQIEQAQQAIPLPQDQGPPTPSQQDQPPPAVPEPMPDARGLLGILSHPTQRPTEPVTTLPPVTAAPADNVGNLLAQLSADPHSSSEVQYLMSSMANGKA